MCMGIFVFLHAHFFLKKKKSVDISGYKHIINIEKRLNDCLIVLKSNLTVRRGRTIV